MAQDVALVAVLLYCGARQDVRGSFGNTPLWGRSASSVQALLRNPTEQAIARALPHDVQEIAERVRQARQERERQEKERQEKARQERERQERERQARQERERQERERQERERQEQERQELSRQRLELPVSEWSVDHVCNMLKTLGPNYVKHVDAFRAHDVDGEMLMHLETDMFAELGVTSLTHKKKISWTVKSHSVSMAAPASSSEQKVAAKAKKLPTSSPLLNATVFYDNRVADNKFLHIRVNYARNLPKMDTWGTADPYVVVSFSPHLGGDRDDKRTSTIKNTQNPDWEEKDAKFEIKMGVQEMFGRQLRLTVMDWDRGTKDDVCGTVLMSMDEIPVMGPDLQDEAAAATWVGEHATKDWLINLDPSVKNKKK